VTKSRVHSTRPTPSGRRFASVGRGGERLWS
jgi:hypothetical protein